MDDSNYDQIMERVAQLQGLLDTPPPAEADEKADGPLLHSEAQALAKDLGEYLRKLHQEDLNSHNANNTWLQQIDATVRHVDENLIILAVLIMVMPFVVRSCGG